MAGSNYKSQANLESGPLGRFRLRACLKTARSAVVGAATISGRNGNTANRKSFREKGRLALLLLPYRPLRVCSVVAPSHPSFLTKTASLGLFQRTVRGTGACQQLTGLSRDERFGQELLELQGPEHGCGSECPNNAARRWTSFPSDSRGRS